AVGTRRRQRRFPSSPSLPPPEPFPLIELFRGLDQQIDHLGSNLLVGYSNPRRIKIAANLAEHILVTCFLKIGLDHFAGIGLSIVLAQMGCRPETEKLVAARDDLEFGLLIMGKLAF